MKIIGLMGKAYSGKTTIAKHLEKLGFKRLAFADTLKDIAIAYFNLTPEEVYIQKSELARTILQGLGSVIRDMFDEEFFIREIAMKMKYSGYDCFVIDDIRLAEEAEFIKSLGGAVIKVECPNSPLELTNDQQVHITEQIDAIPYDHLISAEYGCMAKLEEGIEAIIETTKPFEKEKVTEQGDTKNESDKQIVNIVLEDIAKYGSLRQSAL